MSNRLLGILILFGFFALGYLGYIYFFVYNNATLVIHSNVPGYRLSLSASQLTNIVDINCDEPKCQVPKLPPFEYTIRLTKDGYNDISQNIKLEKSKVAEVIVEFSKIITLSEIDIVSKSKQVQDKIEELRQKSSKYAFFDLGEKGTYYFDQKGGRLAFGFTDIAGKESGELGFFDKVTVQEMSLSLVYGDTPDILLILGKDLYVFQRDTKRFLPIPLKVTPHYAKIIEGEGYAFTTDVGTYFYNQREDKLDYFSLFYDGVVLDASTVIGLIPKDDTVRRKNFGLSGTTSVIMKYDRADLSKKPIFQSEKNLTRLYQYAGGVFVEDEEGNVFRLDGIQ